MAIPERLEGSDWELRQGKDMPLDSFCGEVTARTGQYGHIWHVWNARIEYCDYHHIGGLKAPCALVLKNRRDRINVFERRAALAERAGGV